MDDAEIRALPARRWTQEANSSVSGTDFTRRVCPANRIPSFQSTTQCASSTAASGIVTKTAGTPRHPRLTCISGAASSLPR